MTDTNKLKELAERATPTGWTHDADRYVVAQSDQVNDGWNICLCEGPDSKKNRDFIAAANPQAILGLIAEVERLESEIDQCASALPGTYYMDPPDGGNVSIPEQIRRMAKDAARYRWLIASAWYVGPEPKGDTEAVSWHDHNDTMHGVTTAIDAAIEGATQ